MQRLTHTSIWWDQRGDRVILFWRLRTTVAFRIFFAFSMLYCVSLLLAPVYVISQVGLAQGYGPVIIFLGLATLFGLLALLLYGWVKREQYLYLRRRSLDIGQGLRLDVEREKIVLSTGVGGTMEGGSRYRVMLRQAGNAKPLCLACATAEPDPSAINLVLARKSGEPVGDKLRRTT